MWRMSFFLNWATGGRIAELLCYRLHMERRVFWIKAINAMFRDPLHVKRAYRWQRREKMRRTREALESRFPAEWEYDFLPLEEARHKPPREEG